MNISPYFRNLRTAYVAELDDLTTDSEGNNILGKRLSQRRKEMEFLVHMLEISPEMVAVVFHKGFRFTELAVMDHLVSLDADELPEWNSLADSIALEPWTRDLIQTVQKQPMGDWFLAVAAGLEYLYNRPDHSQSPHTDDSVDSENNDEDVEEQEARIRDEAGADWMASQGFDRKE